jgi:ABC-2 type transport system ATP-binding protein
MVTNALEQHAPIHAVELDGASRRFGGTLALDDCRLTIEPGETVALLGRNGAGKSTAIGLMLGLLDPSAGRVRTLGLDPRIAVRSGRVGAMLQAAGLPVGARVGELVDLARALAPAPLTRDAVLARAGLVPLAGRRVDTLSGGETQRVRFAMAIAGDPDLVFLDEPTTGFDPAARRSAWDLIRTLRSLGKTILLTTHYLDEAQQLADRVAVIHAGRIVSLGTPAALIGDAQRVEIRFVRDGEPIVIATDDPTQTLHELTSEALASGGRLQHLEVRRPTLEDVYLELVGKEDEGAE